MAHCLCAPNSDRKWPNNKLYCDCHSYGNYYSDAESHTNVARRDATVTEKRIFHFIIAERETSASNSRWITLEPSNYWRNRKYLAFTHHRVDEKKTLNAGSFFFCWCRHPMLVATALTIPTCDGISETLSWIRESVSGLKNEIHKNVGHRMWEIFYKLN